ncbi:hypothetical protein PI124_g10002 [Phytophthora idaei]|nr:hypothetical protein PI124_g10002 [Phytophthora idaei]
MCRVVFFTLEGKFDARWIVVSSVLTKTLEMVLNDSASPTTPSCEPDSVAGTSSTNVMKPEDTPPKPEPLSQRVTESPSPGQHCQRQHQVSQAVAE